MAINGALSQSLVHFLPFNSFAAVSWSLPLGWPDRFMNEMAHSFVHFTKQGPWKRVVLGSWNDRWRRLWSPEDPFSSGGIVSQVGSGGPYVKAGTW